MNNSAIPPTSRLDLRGAQEFAADEGQMRELMATFELSLCKEIATIEAALASHDALKVEHSLHALKGFMSLFAAQALSQAVVDLYQDSRSQTLDTTRAKFESIRPEMMSLIGEVRAWLGRL